MVPDADTPVFMSFYLDQAAVSGLGFIDRVTQDLKKSVDTALQVIRPEDHARTETDPVRALKG